MTENSSNGQTGKGQNQHDSSGPLPLQYADLEFEADQLLQEMANRLAEKEEENGGAGWRNTEPEFLSELADDQMDDFVAAVENGDRDEALEQAADATNFILMTLANLPTKHQSQPEQRP